LENKEIILFLKEGKGNKNQMESERVEKSINRRKKEKETC
jgi:hypothetical protein